MNPYRAMKYKETENSMETKSLREAMNPREVMLLGRE